MSSRLRTFKSASEGQGTRGNGAPWPPTGPGGQDDFATDASGGHRMSAAYLPDTARTPSRD
jgi:hypothetical protein